MQKQPGSRLVSSLHQSPLQKVSTVPLPGDGCHTAWSLCAFVTSATCLNVLPFVHVVPFLALMCRHFSSPLSPQLSPDTPFTCLGSHYQTWPNKCVHNNEPFSIYIYYLYWFLDKFTTLKILCWKNNLFLSLFCIGMATCSKPFFRLPKWHRALFVVHQMLTKIAGYIKPRIFCRAQF